MNTKQAVINKAVELGAEFSKMRTKKVSFSDLARTDAKFIKFDDLKWSNENHWDDLKSFARSQGFILTDSI